MNFKKCFVFILLVIIFTGCPLNEFFDDGEESYSESEPNDTLATANTIEIERTYSAILDNDNDFDCFIVNGDMNTSYDFKVTWENGSNLDLVITGYDINGDLLGEIDDYATGESEIGYISFGNQGTPIYLVVFNKYYSTGTYSILITNQRSITNDKDIQFGTYTDNTNLIKQENNKKYIK